MFFPHCNSFHCIPKVSVKRRRRMEKLAEIRADKVQRLGRSCQVKSPRCSGREQGLHHLAKRSHLGDDSDENTILCCVACNVYIEDNPQWARENGFTERRSP